MAADPFNRTVKQNKLSNSKKKFHLNNPIDYASAGTDQDPKVTNNFSDGKELRELDELKRKMEEVERKYHSAEVRGDKNKNKISKELEGIKKKVEELSQKIVPQGNNENDN